MKTRILATLALASVPAAAIAHPGHVAAQAGHDHWGLYVAAGAAIGLVALFIVLRQSARRNR